MTQLESIAQERAELEFELWAVRQHLHHDAKSEFKRKHDERRIRQITIELRSKWADWKDVEWLTS